MKLFAGKPAECSMLALRPQETPGCQGSIVWSRLTTEKVLIVTSSSLGTLVILGDWSVRRRFYGLRWYAGNVGAHVLTLHVKHCTGVTARVTIHLYTTAQSTVSASLPTRNYTTYPELSKTVKRFSRTFSILGACRRFNVKTNSSAICRRDTYKTPNILKFISSLYFCYASATRCLFQNPSKFINYRGFSFSRTLQVPF